MNWRRRMFAAVAAVVGVAIVSWLGWNFYQRHAEPVYEGRRLSEWLVAFEPRNVMWGNTVVSRDRWSRSVTERDARRAVHELGTNCLPVLLKMLLATDPPLKTKLLGLLAKQHYWRPHITTANDLHTEAQQAFYILGAQAESAVPELTRMLNENPSSDTRYMVAWVLNYVGPAADSAIPALEKASRSTDVSLAQTASNALRNLRPTDLNLLPDSLRHPKLDPAKLADANSVVNFRYEGRGDLGTQLLESLNDPKFNPYWVRFRLEEENRTAYLRVVTNMVSAPDPPVPNPASSLEAAAALDNARVLAVGEWSSPSRATIPIRSATYRDAELHGRLIVYEDSGKSGGTMIFLELRDVTLGAWEIPPMIYVDPQKCLTFELRDAQGRTVAPSPVAQGTACPASWASVPVEGSLKLRVDRILPPQQNPTGGLILAPGQVEWKIAPSDTNTYFLSATFAPPSDQTNSLDYQVWNGTLDLPPVKLPVKLPAHAH